MQFTFTRVIVDERAGTLHTNGWLGLRWTDDMMMWDPSSFGDLQSLKLHSDQLWKPDVVVYNSINGYETLPGAHLVLLSSGVVYYIPPLSLTTPCELDLSHWPFDKQTCTSRFGAWAHDSSEIILGILDNQTQADMKHYEQSGSSWLITETKAEVNSMQFDCCSPPYQDVVFTLQLHRKSPFDAKIVLAPATVVWFLVLVTFWMKPQCLERIHVGCTAILILTLVLIYLRLSLPSSNKTPLVVLFHVTLLALSALGVLVTLINSNLVRRTYNVPAWLVCMVQGRAGSFLCTGSSNSLNSQRAMKVQDELHSDVESGSTGTVTHLMQKAHLTPTSSASMRQLVHARSNWNQVATFIDRLAFCVYLIIMAVIGVQYLVL